MNYYYVAVSEVINKYGKNHPYYSMIVVALYGLLNKYSLYQDIVLDVFHKTNIIIEKDSVNSIFKKHNIKTDDYFQGDDILASENFFVPAVSSSGKFLLSNYNNDFELFEEKPFIICGDYNVSSSILLNSFIHEFSHLIKSERNSYLEEEDEIEKAYYLRCGIHYYKNSILKNDNSFFENDYFGSLDEVINVIQTTEIMNIIMGLDGIVDDEEIQDFLNKLDRKKIQKDFGYEDAVVAFRPLWEIDSFKDLIEESIVCGDLKTIVEKFKALCPNHSFIELADAIEDIDNLKVDEDNNDNSYSLNIVKDIYKSIKDNIYEKKKDIID